MKLQKLAGNKLAVIMANTVAVIVVLIPFHAFLTVWGASLVGHYTALRLWKEVLLLGLLAISLVLVVRDGKLRWKLISYKLHWLIFGYLLLQLIIGLVAILTHSVSAKALGFALIINLRFLAFFLIAWAAAGYIPALRKRWPAWVFWPLAVVVVVGLVQYFLLPYDFLAHFGYSQNTIYPYETINHNLQRLRVMSTLRGANPLGAYLVLTLSLGAAWFYKTRKRWLGVLLIAGLAVLVLSFSRSAWIGMVISLAILAWSLITSPRARRILIGVAAGLAVVTAIATAALWDSTVFQDAVFHTDDHSTIATSSNQGHLTHLKEGLSDLAHHPLGSGPGTAGPASVYNDHPARIAENYFVQVGQEVGWLGLIVFVMITVVVARALWRRRNQTLALGLFAALIGITFVNLLSHAWTDDTLAYLWWGLAGIAVTTDLGAQDETA